jgi:ABC-type multidrug transport system fused ATPase/permease subunit
LDKLFIDTLIQAVGKSDWWPSFKVIVIVVILRYLLSTYRNIASRGVGYTNNTLSRKFSSKIDELLAIKHSQIDIEMIENPEFKDRFAKIEREGSGRAFQIVSSFAELPRTIAGIISSLSIFITFNIWVVLLSIVFTIPGVLLDAVNTKKEYLLEDNLKTKYRMWSMLTYFLIRAKSYMELRLLGISDFLIKKMTGIQNEIIETKRIARKQRLIARTIISIPEDFYFYALDAYFGFLAILGKITIGSAQAYVRAIANFKDNFTALTGAIIQYYENYLYVADVIWFLDLNPKQDVRRGKKFLPTTNPGIVFKDVWFRYSNSEDWIIKGVNFKIDPRDNVALVGENGAGKTTLVKLLCGFYLPTKGEILINGVNLNKYSLITYWKQLAVLFQDFEEYDFSARESISYGNIEKVNNLAEIKKYAQMADIHDWIESLQLKYETPMSRWYTKGVTPSGGQRQRIGIARTLIKNGKIIVLDEPTSNVDPQAEEDIFNEVLKLGKNKILIFISHRFSTVRRADKILLLENGTISEQGSHDELMKQKGKYAHLFNLQAKSYQ